MHIPATLTPAQFEKHICEWLAEAGRGLCNLKVTHLPVVQGRGGDYEIDVLARFAAFDGAEFVVLVECKHHRNPIKRDVIQVLESKLRDTKAQKGIVASTSKFQKGALEYAAEHGIATLLVSDAGTEYLTKSWGAGPSQKTPGRAIAWLCQPTEDGMTTLRRADYDGSEGLRNWLRDSAQ